MDTGHQVDPAKPQEGDLEITSRDLKYFDTIVCDLHFFTATMVSYIDRVESRTPRSVMIRNFISRGMEGLGSIRDLCKRGKYADSGILYRACVDLFIHLKYVSDNNLFEEYDHFTLSQRSKLANDALQNEEIRVSLSEDELKLLKGIVNRYNKAAKEKGKAKWEKPSAKAVLAGRYESLYLVGYDFLSTCVVHPLLDTGERDFTRLRFLKSTYLDRDIRSILYNAIQTQIILMTLGFNLLGSEKYQAALVCLVAIERSVHGGSLDYSSTLKRVIVIEEHREGEQYDLLIRKE